MAENIQEFTVGQLIERCTDVEIGEFAPPDLVIVQMEIVDRIKASQKEYTYMF
jgi:hypothetical protein